MKEISGVSKLQDAEHIAVIFYYHFVMMIYGCLWGEYW